MFINPTLSRREPRRGSVLALVAVLLIVLVAFLAIALDGGGLLEEYRHAQAVADAAALAAATDLFVHYPANGGMDTTGTGLASAQASITTNGYDPNLAKITFAPGRPQTSGLPVGTSTNVAGDPGKIGMVDTNGKLNPGYVEVVVGYPRVQGFSTIFSYWSGSTNSTVTVSARAVARAFWVPFKDGIIALNPTAKASLVANGTNADTVVQGANILVNSNNYNAAVTTGNAFVADNSSIQITGSSPGYNGTFLNGPGGTANTPQTGVPPTPDPLAYLPPPPMPSAGTDTVTSMAGGGKLHTWTPGYYGGNQSISGQDALTMQPGAYYIDGNFNFSGQGAMLANGVFIYCTGAMAVSGGSTVTMSPMVLDPSGSGSLGMMVPGPGNSAPTWVATGVSSSMDPYAGISYFQARSSSAAVNLVGNGQYNITGTVYAKAAQVGIQGNGDAGIGSQVIADTIVTGGNGQTTINWNVDLSAKTRLITLVY